MEDTLYVQLNTVQTQDRGFSCRDGDSRGQSRVQGVSNVLFLDLGTSYPSAFNLQKFAKPYIQHTCILKKLCFKKSFFKKGKGDESACHRAAPT